MIPTGVVESLKKLQFNKQFLNLCEGCLSEFLVALYRFNLLTLGIVHPKTKIQSSFSHYHDVYKPAFFGGAQINTFLCSTEERKSHDFKK